jgi:hypothetical protein
MPDSIAAAENQAAINKKLITLINEKLVATGAKLDAVDVRLEIIGAKLDRVLHLIEPPTRPKPVRKAARPMPDEAEAEGEPRPQ